MVIQKILKWALNLSASYVPKSSLSFHDKCIVAALGIPLCSTPTRIGKWIRWIPPEGDQIKLNIDGSCIENMATGGGILRKSLGDII